MNIYFTADEGETITNFRIAEAVINLCNEDWKIDALTVAKMILLQIEADQKLEYCGCAERSENGT